MNYYASFNYVDVGNTKSGWERVPVADLEAYRAKFNNIDFCKSVARYASQEPEDKEPILMGINIDLDGDDLAVVLNEARLLGDYFYRGWELKKEEVRFYYSGNRSIHIEIQPETLNIIPHKSLHQYIKEVMGIIADKLELECVDSSLYARRHLFRCTGTIHSKTNRYKIELDPSDLNLPPEEIIKLSATNRGSLYPEEAVELSKNETASDCFRELFEIAKSSVEESSYRSSNIEHLSILRGISKPPACVQDLLENNIRVKGTRNRATLALVTFFKDIGKNEDEIIELLTFWAKAMPQSLTSADEQERIEEVKSLAHYVFTPEGSNYHFACPFILSLGSKESPIICKKRCQLRISKTVKDGISVLPNNATPVAYFPEVGDFLAELVYDPITKKAAFALYNPQTDEVTYVDEIGIEFPNIYVPLIDANVLKGSVLLPSKAEEYGSDDELYTEVGAFEAKYFYEPDKFHRTLNTHYVFFTWLHDKFRSGCYLQFLGRAGGGKSRAMEAIGYLCYHATKLAGADSSASMLRMLDKYRGTSLIDEATFTDRSEAHSAIVQMLNVGYKLDGTVSRCEGDENKPVRYMVGGPKILATRDDFADDGLRSRCFVKRMGRDMRIKEGEHSQPFVLPPTFEAEALVLRNKLLMWRFRHWKTASLNPALEIKGVESRINEIIVPILSVMDSETAKADIEEIAKKQQEDWKQQRQTSLEGEVLKAIQEKGFNDNDILPSELAEIINIDRKDKFISVNSVTKALKKMELGLHKYGNRWLLSNSAKNKELLQVLFKDYDLAETTPKDF